jgi:predicted 2-oxoglutarate/Fe(II)-dependent dioxygenase YbiX
MEYQWYLNVENNVPWVKAETVFTDFEIKKIIEIGKDLERSTPTEAKLGLEGTKDSKYRKCNLSWIRSDLKDNQWIFRHLSDVLNEINKFHFKFDVDMIQNLQFTEYTSEGDFYGKHLDLGCEETRPRKISFSIQLSDPSEYTGGELKFYYENSPEIVDKKRGCLTAFPSYVLHEVTPVTHGTRYALVGWVCGPKFK